MRAEQRRRLERDRRGPAHLDRHARHFHAAADRVVDLRDHAARAQVLVAEQVGGVEDRAARHSGFAEDPHGLDLVVLRRPRRDHRRDLVPVVAAQDLQLIVLVPLQVGAADHVEQSVPHPQRRDHQVDVVVRPAAARRVQVGRTEQAHAVAVAHRRHAAGQVVAHQRRPQEVEHRVLHRHLDRLPAPGAEPLDVGGEDRHAEMHAGAAVTERDSGLERRRLGRAGHREDAARGLADHVEALVVRPRPPRAEPLDGRVDDVRLDRLHRVVGEAEFLEHPVRVVLRDDVGARDQPSQHLAAALLLEVERDRTLVGVEHQEVDRVRVGTFRDHAAPGLAARRLDLDHVGAEPGEKLGAGSARLPLREVHDADSVECCHAGFLARRAAPAQRRSYGASPRPVTTTGAGDRRPEIARRSSRATARTCARFFSDRASRIRRPP